MDEGKVEFSKTLESLRMQLESAIENAKGQALQFEAMEIALEFKVGVTRSEHAEGGLSFWVVELGAGVEGTAESMQTVTLKMKPTLRSGLPVRIAAHQAESPLAGGSHNVTPRTAAGAAAGRGNGGADNADATGG